MRRLCVGSVLGIAVLLPCLWAQDGIRRAVVKRLDLDRMRLTLTVAGKEQDFGLTENTQVLSAPGKNLKERLAGFKEGAAIFFRADKRGDAEIISHLKLADGAGGFAKVDTSRLKPLTE